MAGVLFNQEWSEPLTQRDTVVVGIGLSLVDNLALPWQDGVSFLKPATTVATAGQTSQAQISEDLLMAPQGDFYSGVMQMQLVLSDNVNSANISPGGWLDQIAWIQKGTHTTGPAHDNQNFPFLGERLQQFIEAPVIVLVGNLFLSLGDSLNYWMDQSPTMTGDYLVTIICSEMGGLWGDVLGQVLSFQEQFSDQIVLSDVSPTIIGEYDISIICSEMGGLWGDVVQEILTGGNLTETLSDSLTMSDALGIGYGEGMVEQLSFSDAGGLGFGFLIADQLTLSDADVVVLGFAKVFSDTLTLSDSIADGYGNVVTDTIVFSDSESLGYGLSTVDQLVLSDSLGLGYGDLITDSLTLSDSLILGYGDLIADQMTLSDAFSLAMVLSEVLSDTLTLSDQIAAGYGNAISEQLSFSDSLLIGYGDLIADQMTMSDSAVLAFPALSEVLSDSLTLLDALAIGYGDATTDQLSLSESVIAGYGNATSDSLTLSDSVIDVLGLNKTLSDTLILSDAISVGYGLGTTDSLTLTDSIANGPGNQLVDSLTLSDALGVGYGDAINDQLVMSDAMGSSSGGSQLTESLSDSLTLSDAIAIGYGDRVSDQMVMADQSPTITGEYDVAIICPHMGGLWSDGLSKLRGLAEVLSDSLTLSDFYFAILAPLGNIVDFMTMSDSLLIGYGDKITDSLLITDQFGFAVGGPALQESLSDSLTLTEHVDILFTFPVFADMFVLSDAFAFNLGTAFGEIDEQLSDTLSLSDFIRVGYGNRVSDQLALSDQFQTGSGLGIAESLQNVVQLAQDNFTRPNENPLNAAVWTVPDSKNSFQIVSNKCILNSPLTVASADLYTGISWPNDQYAEVTITQALANTELDILLRCDLVEQNYYEFGWTSNGTNITPFIAEVIGGVRSVLWTGSAIAFSSGDVYRAVALGSLLSLYRNGVLLQTVTNFDIASGTAGFQMSTSSAGATTDIQASNFDGGLAVGLREQLTLSYGLLPVELQIQEIQQAQDNFTRANESPLNPAAWTTMHFATPLQIVSDKCQATSVAIISGETYSGINWQNDQYVEVTLGSSNVGGRFDIRLRSGEDIGTGFPFGYDFGFIDNGNGTASLYIELLFATGVVTQLWGKPNAPFSDGDVFRAVVIGKTVALYQNGLLLAWVNDSNFTNGAVSLMEYAPSALTDIQISNFDGGVPTSLLIEQVVLSYGDLIADSMSLSDSFATNYQPIETLSDSLAQTDLLSGIGYGLSLSDTNVLSDSIAVEYDLIVADQLVLSDMLSQSSQTAFTDQLVLSDSLLLGYGSLIADQLTLTDSLSVAINSLRISDSLTLTDNLTIQLLGAVISLFPQDSLSMTDSLLLGIGDSVSEQLVLVEQLGLGYGLLISDQLVMSESLAFSFVLSQALSDTLTLTDALRVGYGLQIADQLTLSDALALGFNYQITDQLTLVEAVVVGFNLILKDQLVQSDQVVVGFGNTVSDQISQADQMAFVEGLVVLIADATPAQLDALAALFTYALQVNDVVTIREQLTLLYGLITSDGLVQADELDENLLLPLLLVLSDDDSANLIEAVIAEIVFAPSAIVLHSLTVLPQLISGLQVINEVDVETVSLTIAEV